MTDLAYNCPECGAPCEQPQGCGCLNRTDPTDDDVRRWACEWAELDGWQYRPPRSDADLAEAVRVKCQAVYITQASTKQLMVELYYKGPTAFMREVMRIVDGT